MPNLSSMGLPDSNATNDELIDHIAMLQKTIEYYFSGGIDSTNMREIGGWGIGADILASKANTVGLSTRVTAGDDIRMWAGSTDMNTAAFRVYESGKVVLNNAQITGGTITWGAANAPLYSDILGTKPPANADNTDATIIVNGSNFTKVAGAYVYSGPADYNQITGTKPPSNADNTSGALPTSLGINYTKVGASYVYTGTLNANQINAGTINANYINGGTISGVDINVANDIIVGNKITFNPSVQTVDKSLTFPGQGSLDFKTNMVRLSGVSVIDLQASSVTLNNFPIATQSWVNSNAIAKYG